MKQLYVYIVTWMIFKYYKEICVSFLYACTFIAILYAMITMMKPYIILLYVER